MWVAFTWLAWIVSAAVLVWMAADFVKTNSSYDDGVLLSSREGVDELFASAKNGETA
jgi:hypothetical protein